MTKIPGRAVDKSREPFQFWGTDYISERLKLELQNFDRLCWVLAYAWQITPKGAWSESSDNYFIFLKSQLYLRNSWSLSRKILYTDKLGLYQLWPWDDKLRKIAPNVHGQSQVSFFNARRYGTRFMLSSYVCPFVSPSVRLSVTIRHCTKTAKLKDHANNAIQKCDSPGTLAF